MRVKCWFASVLGVLFLAVGTAAQSALKPIQFSDTRLSNGLRVIISEDHYAPVYAIAVSYGVGSKDEREGRTGFAHLFEHMMFKGSENVGPGEHFFLIFNYGGIDERHHQHRPHAVLRDPAEEPARPRPVPGIRPHAVAGHHQRESRQPAPGRAGGAAPAARQPAVRQEPGALQRAGVRQLRLQALGDRLDGGSERRLGGRRGELLQDLLRAEQRRAGAGGRSRHQGDAGEGREVLRQHSAAAEPRSRWISPSRSEGRAARDDDRTSWRACRRSIWATGFRRRRTPTGRRSPCWARSSAAARARGCISGW